MSEKFIFVKKKIGESVYIESRPEEENGYDYNSEDHFDTIGDGSYYELTDIDKVIKALQEVKANGANYVEIDFNIDHQEMEITGYEYRQANEEERKKYFDEIEEEKRIAREIQIQQLEKKLEELKKVK